MIRIVTHAEIDTDKWDDCIRKDAAQLFYGLSWYLDMLTPEWDALVYNDYEAVFPLIKGKKWGIAYLFRPYGTQQLGVFSRVPQTPELVAEMLAAIPKKYRFVDVFLNYTNPVGLLNARQLSPNSNYELNLHRMYQEIYEGYSKRTIRNLKTAKKHKHKIFEYDSPELLINLFKENKGKKLKTLESAHYEKMLHIMHVMLHKHRGYIWTIHDAHNTAICGAFFVEIMGRIVLLFSATTAQGRAEQAITFLLDELFIARSGSQVIFDFEGSNIEGLSDFYAGFGSVKKIYYNLKINKLPAPIRWLK